MWTVQAASIPLRCWACIAHEMWKHAPSLLSCLEDSRKRILWNLAIHLKACKDREKKEKQLPLCGHKFSERCWTWRLHSHHIGTFYKQLVKGFLPRPACKRLKFRPPAASGEEAMQKVRNTATVWLFRNFRVRFEPSGNRTLTRHDASPVASLSGGRLALASSCTEPASCHNPASSYQWRSKELASVSDFAAIFTALGSSIHMSEADLWEALT